MWVFLIAVCKGAGDPTSCKCYGNTPSLQINYLEGKKRKSYSFKQQLDFASVSPFLAVFLCAGLGLKANVTACVPSLCQLKPETEGSSRHLPWLCLADLAGRMAIQFCNGLSATWKPAVIQALHKCLEMWTEVGQKCKLKRYNGR